jgi:Tol biopolymer transport system component
VTWPRGVLAVLAAALVLVPVGALAAPGDNTRVSLSDAEAQPAQESSGSAFSATGRFVLFTSKDSLAGTPSGGFRQLYVRDLVDGTTRLASASAAGAAANADVDEDEMNIPYAISGDGRYVTFASVATNLVGTDANAALKDVFRKDMTTGEVIVVSVNDAGEQANQSVQGNPDISADGSRITYVTGAATNLISGGDANLADMDVVVRDIPASKTILVSQSTAGVQAADFTERPAISADGRWVAFEAGADSNNLVPDDANAASDAFVRDLTGNTTTRVSVTTAGATPGGVNFPDVSGDGRYVTFQTATSYDAANDANAAADIYRRDVVAGQTTLVSAVNATDAAAAAGDSRQAAISADGSRVAFHSAANVMPPDGNAANADVYIRDIGTKAVQRANTPQAANEATGAGISANGAFVGFNYNDAAAAPFMTGDTNMLKDVFAHEFAPSDGTPPPIDLTAPAEGTTTTDASIAVTGTGATDVSGLVALAVNGTALAPAADGSFSTSVPLAVGANTITATALDGAGNTATVTRNVTRIEPTPDPGPDPDPEPGPDPDPDPDPTPSKPRPRKLTLKVRPGRDVELPIKFAMSGRLLMPASVKASAGCRGRVTVNVRAGKRQVRQLKPRLKLKGRTCAYKTRLKLKNRRRVGSAKKLRVRAHFPGNSRLRARSSKTARPTIAR